MLEKASTIKRFERSTFGSGLKQAGITKDQYQFFKDQTSVINKNREEGVKMSKY